MWKQIVMYMSTFTVKSVRLPRPSGLMRKEGGRPGGGRSRRPEEEAHLPLAREKRRRQRCRCLDVGQRERSQADATDEWPAGKTDDEKDGRLRRL